MSTDRFAVTARDLASDIVGSVTLALDLIDQVNRGPLTTDDLCSLEYVADSCPTFSTITFAIPSPPTSIDDDLATFHITALNGPSWRVIVSREDHA